MNSTSKIGLSSKDPWGVINRGWHLSTRVCLPTLDLSGSRDHRLSLFGDQFYCRSFPGFVAFHQDRESPVISES
jgi:hypothetical protein